MPLIALALALALPACGDRDPTGPEANADNTLVPAPTEVTLRLGEEKAVDGSVLHVSFANVIQDSRCPIDAICVWEGNAEVEVGIRAGMGPTFPLRLNTTLEPRDAVWNGVRITLLELQPYPQASEPDPPDTTPPTVRLRVEPVS